MNSFNFVCYSSCCRGAKLGYSESFHGYKLYHCMGCGKIIDRKNAINDIRHARKLLRDVAKIIPKI